MIGYEEYLQKYPQVARRRSDKMLSDRNAVFWNAQGRDYCLLPHKSSDDEVVIVKLQGLTCECNVFQQKKACPHVAAALGLIEKNGGEIPYTEPAAQVQRRLELLKTSTKSVFYNPSTAFVQNVLPFLRALSEKEKEDFFLQVARDYQEADSNLSEYDFFVCCEKAREAGAKPGKILFRHRQECLKGVTSLLKRGYPKLFSDKETETIVKEIAASDELAQEYLPFLEREYSEHFSPKQLARYYLSENGYHSSPFGVNRLMKRLLLEEPPLYEEYLAFFDGTIFPDYYDLEVSDIQRLIQAGYGDKAEKVMECFVRNMKTIEEYEQIRELMSHEQFLSAWKNRMDGKSEYWRGRKTEFELEVGLLEDPEEDVGVYDFEDMSLHLLEVIARERPAYKKEALGVVRKVYRGASKARERKKQMEALMLLVRVDDPIAVKYVSEWDESLKKGEEMVYLAAVGLHFDALPKLLGDLKRMEGFDAAGQN